MITKVQTANEIWVSMGIIGPQTEIDRFKTQCIIRGAEESRYWGDGTSHFIRAVPVGAPVEVGKDHSYDEPISNLRDRDIAPGVYEVAFDVPHRLLTSMFEDMAAMFPALAFDCNCIGSMDEFIGYGWFNVPEGGEPFDYHDVPEDYWNNGGMKRTPAADAAHRAVLEKLARTARDASAR